MNGVNKDGLRKKILKLRDGLEADERSALDASIRAEVMSLIHERAADTVLIYVSFRSEVDTYGIISDCLDTGVRVAVPRVEGEDIGFYYIDSFDDLVSGYMGIREPAEGSRPYDDAADKTVIIVPGSVFDLQNDRIGYGGGYYDRFLTRNPGIYSIGLAYPCQIVESIPVDEWDRPLDTVVYKPAQEGI